MANPSLARRSKRPSVNVFHATDAERPLTTVTDRKPTRRSYQALPSAPTQQPQLQQHQNQRYQQFINFNNFVYDGAQASTAPVSSQAFNNTGASPNPGQQQNALGQSGGCVQPWDSQVAGSVGREGGSESSNAWADVARDQPDASDNTRVGRPQQQHRHPADFDQSAASTTRTTADTRSDGANERPGPRTWSDVGRQQRRGGSKTVAKEHGQGGVISEGNRAARTRGEDVENNVFEQHRGNRGQGGAGIEDPIVAKPLGGQTLSRISLDGGAENGTGAFQTGKGGKVKPMLSFSGEDRHLVIESASPQIPIQRDIERDYRMCVEARSYYSQRGECFA